MVVIGPGFYDKSHAPNTNQYHEMYANTTYNTGGNHQHERRLNDGDNVDAIDIVGSFCEADPEL